ncbi:MAG TPA: amidase [Polyangiaceae bacterium]|nr:amidase [Polyangiaceae bacterium]
MDLTAASATELALLIRTRSASAEEVIDAHLARIADVNPLVNAIVRLDAQGARQRAREADAALDRGAPWGPLHGVPFTLKDMHAAQAMPGSLGTRASERVATEDGVIADRLKRAGAILLGKTNMSNGVQTSSEQFGPTANPYDSSRTPGGSSGGSAAAIAARISPFDVGTDLSGSIRMPAHFTGVYGLRPTTQRIPLAGMIYAPPGVPRFDRIFSAAGPMARTAADIALLFRLLAGADSRDPDVPPVPVRDAETLDVRGLRVAIAPSIAGIRVTREIQTAIAQLGSRLSNAGARVDAREPVAFENLLAAFRRLFRILLSSAGRGGEAPSNLMVALEERDRFMVSIEPFFSEYDAFLCPAAICTAFPLGPPGSSVDIDGELAPSIAIDHPTILATYTGAPSLVVPLALGAGGLPIGVQLVGRRWSDERLIAVGAAIADVVGPLPPPEHAKWPKNAQSATPRPSSG